MNSHTVCNILLSLLIFILNLIELNASQEVTLTCGSNQSTQRGMPGYPGKRGPKGLVGPPGDKGNRGDKGEQGHCPDFCASALDRLTQVETELQAFKECMNSCVNGRCVNENNFFVCSCSSGFSGRNCDENFCNDPPCTAHSRCTGPNQCTCDEGYQFALGRCEPVCFGARSCGDRGKCASPGECRCNPGYSGSTTGCQNYNCNQHSCEAHSHCSGPNECSCDEGYQLTDGECTDSFLDCDDVSRAGFTRSGVYRLTVPGRSQKDRVYCEIESGGVGWLVFQRRIDGSVNFNQNWTDYLTRFGDLNGEFWLGLDLLHAITSTKFYQLRVDLEDWNGNTAYAVYKTFSIGNSQSNYRLTVLGYNGTAGDSLEYHNNQQFSTKDQDNDATSSHCAQIYSGGYWYNNCLYSNLNGEYLRDGQVNSIGINWYHWKDNLYSMKKAEMKIRPN